MQPGDTYYMTFVVRDSAGAGVTGLVDTTNIVLRQYQDGAASALSATLAEIANGFYRYAITLGNSGAQYYFEAEMVAPSTHFPSGNIHVLEVETYDIDSLYARVIVPRVSQSLTSTPTTDTTLTIDANRYHEVEVTIVDKAGDPIDLSGYDTWTFNVRDQVHSVSPDYTLSSGISGDANGIVTFSIPEDASFYTAIDTPITEGKNSIDLYYDVTANKDATASQTQNIMRGKLVLRRYEGSA